MPIGIGQLSRLQKLGLFVVGMGDKFAGISELANISRIGEELRISGIALVRDPNDAHVACLKQKTNLQRLYLDWMADDTKEVNTELEQAVLDGLEPPPGIKEMEISGYSGRQYTQWMQNQVGGGVHNQSRFPFLRVMRLCDLPNLKNLHGLMELPCLEELYLQHMPCLESISGGPFPSLVTLGMYRLPCLGEVWLVAERSMPDGEQGGGYYNSTPQLGQVRLGNCLTILNINDCPNLEVKPHLPPSLQHIWFWGSEQMLQSPGQCEGSSLSPSFRHLKKLEQWEVTRLGSGHVLELLQHLTALKSLEINRFSELPESLGELRSLQKLTIESCPSLISLPQSMSHLSSLQLLKIERCYALQQLPDCLGELCSLRILEINYLTGLTCLPQSIFCLTTSLQELKIHGCPGLTSLPQGIEGLTSLQKLSICNCMGLTSLPQGIKGLISLEELYVASCPKIKSLPEGIKGLTALKKLEIRCCPYLKRRCQRQTGEDWHLISHIPDVRLGRVERDVATMWGGFGQIGSK